VATQYLSLPPIWYREVNQSSLTALLTLVTCHSWRGLLDNEHAGEVKIREGQGQG
jgi:hypothetical protein